MDLRLYVTHHLNGFNHLFFFSQSLSQMGEGPQNISTVTSYKFQHVLMTAFHEIRFRGILYMSLGLTFGKKQHFTVYSYKVPTTSCTTSYITVVKSYLILIK